MWDTVYGFGGNGDLTTPEIRHGGHCVFDGPFANTTRAYSAISEGPHHDVEFLPHCLCRGFASATDDKKIVEKLQALVSKDFVEETLQAPDYGSFFKKFEQGAHNAIPQFIKGDWITFTAPNGKCVPFLFQTPTLHGADEGIH